MCRKFVIDITQEREKKTPTMSSWMQTFGLPNLLKRWHKNWLRFLFSWYFLNLFCFYNHNISKVIKYRFRYYQHSEYTSVVNVKIMITPLFWSAIYKMYEISGKSRSLNFISGWVPEIWHIRRITGYISGRVSDIRTRYYGRSDFEFISDRM